MKVLHIVLALQTGGLERVVLDLIKNSSSIVNPYLCCLDEIGASKVEIKELNIPYWVLANFGKNKIKSLINIRQIVIQNNISVIHTHNPGPHFYGSMVGLLCDIPVIHTKHGRNYPANKWAVFKNFIFSWLTYKIVCVSQDASQVALDIEKIPRSKIVTILNGIDITEYSRYSKQIPLNNTGAREKIFLLGIVARLSREKDHCTLLEALSMIVENRKDVRLLVIGDGPLKPALESKVNNLGLSQYCHFLGNRTDVNKLLSYLDLFVLSSTTEGVSLTLLEAMAACLPIVCTDVGGNPEVVQDQVTGVLVPPQQPKTLAEAVLGLINCPEKRLKMGQKGSERVESFFSIRRTVDEYEKLYCEAVDLC